MNCFTQRAAPGSFPCVLAQLAVRQAKLARSSRCKSGPGEGWRPPGSECCVGGGDTAGEAYTTIEWGGLLSRESGLSQGPRPSEVPKAT